MSSKIDITINGTRLEVEIEVEPPEPSNGLQGGYDIKALRTLDHDSRDIWPVISIFAGVEDEVIAAIEREAEKRREP